MIQIYQPNNKNFENNGDMTLMPVSAPIHVILNGAWTAELTHPIDSEGRWKYIEEEAVVKMPSFNGDQLFRIKKVQKQDEGITASMQPIFYDAMEDCWLEDVRPTGKNGQQALEIMLSPNAKYSAQSDITKVTTAYYEYVNFLEALNGDLDQSFINRWGGEILLDNFTVIVNERVGSDRGTEIRYGKNIPENGMSYEEDCSTVITRIYPKAYNGRKMTGTKYVDSPLINRYQTVKTATMTFENIKLKEDLEGDPEETDIVCETQEELNQALRQACNEQYDTGIDKPTISISCDMVLLQNTDLYKDVKELETVSLGDTVHCINTKLEISTEARVVELEYDAVRKKVSSVEIGDYVYQYFDDVTSTIDQVEKVIRPDGTVMAERVQGILNGIYTQLRLQSTAAQKVDGIAFRVEELDESSPMYGCMIWGTQGLQISTERTQDGTDWDWQSAMTARGIIADAIITGLLSDKTGRNYWDLDTGEISMHVKSLTIEGETVEDITSGQVDETLNNFVDTVYNPTIGNLQAQIDGQIETYYYDYEPTLNNEPASEWTTEEDRKQHEGDLFYWKSKGYAYRFFEDGDTWKWQMVQDTDITKALEEAADAKDTADQKRRVFVTQPYPPYDVGDLWVGDDTSEMMRCQRARSSGSYVASDWIKAVKYTDDSELYNFVQNDYNETIKELYNSVDQKSETWYQATDPALEWTEVESTPLQDTAGANILDTAGETIITIWEKEKSLHNGDLWKNSTTNKEYLYQNGEWVEMPIPDEVFDMIDGKAQIFVVQPTPPYDVGDVWFTGTTILVCNTKRENGSFSESDWGKKDNYTDDSALYEFIEGDYSETVENLKNQADKKAETWYQSTDPSTGWTAAEKQIHTGDLWYNTSDEKTYIYNGSAWELTKTTPPDEVFDAIDGKAQIFVSQPKPPYSVGDLWFNSATSDIMTCINSRSTGNYTASDWQKRNKYTDDSYAQEVNQELNEFISDYQDEIKEIQNQVDQKAETWYQTSDPALQWTGKESIPLADTTGASILDTTGATITTIRESEKMLHDGDLWHNPSNNNEYIYQDGEWHKTSIPDDVFDIIDGKAQIFVATPTPPYDVGDLWFNSATSDIMTCVQSRSSGSYTAGDWQKRNKYTDDSYAEKVEDDLSNAINGLDESLTQQEIFNRLTNNGQTQGLYLQNGKLYINGSYIQSGTISGDYIKGGTIEGTTVKGGTVEGSTVKGGTVEGSTVKGGTIEGSVYRYGDDTAYIKLSNGKLFSTNGERAVKISGYNIEIGEKADSEEDIVEGLNSTSISDYGARIACKKSDLIPSIGNNGYVDIGIESIGGMDAFSPIFYKNNDTGDSGYAVVSENANNFNFVYRASGQGGPYLEFYTLFGAYGVNAWSSDIREKEQIEESHSGGIETINKFKHRKFRWKDVVDGLGEKHEGFYVDCGYIAQEMQEINPQFVITVAKGTKNERLQISEQSIIPYITKAIQELSEENKSLRKEIEEIKAMLRREE